MSAREPTQPVITGTPSRSSSMRSGAMIAGAAPTHSGVSTDGHRQRVLDRGHRDLLLQSGAAVAAQRAVDLDRAFVYRRRTLQRARPPALRPVIFRMSPGRAPMRTQVRRRETRDGVTDVLDARFRDAKHER